MAPKLAALLLTVTTACAVSTEPCDWAGYSEQLWETESLENGCGLEVLDVRALGCEKQISEATEPYECSIGFVYRCANELRLEVVKTREPDRVHYTFFGRDDCVTRRSLTPVER
jgi:hypothetical protein